MWKRKTIWATAILVALVACAAIFYGSGQGAVDPQANKVLREKLGSTSMTVFPAVVRKGKEIQHDAEAAGKIADAVASRKLATTRPSEDRVPITGTWHMNELAMYRESAASLGGFVKDHPISTDYALLAEYLVGGKGAVVGVHVFVVDRQGQLAGGYLLNSHVAEFQKVNPHTVDDCSKLVVETIEDQLRMTH
jgi:hypothetical protein